jgi:amino acid adenylation domain-containing protein
MGKKNTIIYGSTQLCKSIMQTLLNKDWNIQLLITDDEDLIAFSKDNNIIVSSTNDTQEVIKHANAPFYLFSIINGRIISDKLLKHNHLIEAINYHDSLLPTYAGVNSTSWAILNGEKFHGITWHKIDEGIDTGDIIEQAKIPIDANETAFSLNLKCTEKAYELFQSVIEKIESNALKAEKQNTNLRSYYGKFKIPRHFGVLRQNLDRDEQSKIVRALSFGDRYPNPITTPKVKINQRFWVVQEMDLKQVKVLDIYGDLTTKQTYSLKEIENSTVSDTEFEQFQAIKKAEEKALQHLQTLQQKTNQNFPRKETRDYQQKIIQVAHGGQEALIFNIYLTFKKLLNINPSITSYFQSEALFDKKSFIYGGEDLSNCSIQALQSMLDQQNKAQLTLFKDLEQRYKMNLQTDIGIYFTQEMHPRKHPIMMRYDNQHLIVEYDKELNDTLEPVLKAIEQLYQGEIVIHPEQKYADICLLSEEDYQTIVYEWNQTDSADPIHETLTELFEAQVEKTPQAIALVYEGETLTYQELNEKANQLARYIQKQYQNITNKVLEPDTLIPLCIHRSLDMIIGILGILKAGGAYVPIDPAFPDARIQYMLEETKAALMITQTELSEKLARVNDQVCLIPLDERAYGTESENNLSANHQPNHLAYVMYTSGSTGKPKGVMVEHKNVVSFTHNRFIKVLPSDSFLFLSSPVFDAAVFDVWLPLMHRGRLFIQKNLQELYLNPTQLKEFIQKNKISHLFITTALFNNLYIANNKIFSSLKYLIVGGEVLNPRLINALSNSSYRPKHLFSAYGPTESTTFSTIYTVPQKILEKNIPIGRPIQHRQTYVLDSTLKPLPVGVVGELCLGGAGLARGYFNQPELTKECFIPNPFATEKDKKKRFTRLYKTGDHVKWLPDGNLEYVGRNDSQIKMRGFRIELSEIEEALTQIPHIQQACVLSKQRNANSEKSSHYLVGYYVLDRSPKESIRKRKTDILEKLSSMLPDYMVPSILVEMERMPLTINGKIDKKALPEPQAHLDTHYTAPRNPTEAQVCQIWQEVLNMPKVGIEDDFFQLGGDSILSIQVSVKLRQLGFHSQSKDIFDYRTIKDLAKNLKKQMKTTAPKNTQKFTESLDPSLLKQLQEQAKKLGKTIEVIYPANSLQQGFIYHHLRHPDDEAYRTQMSWEYHEPLDWEIYQQAWQMAVQRYPILRTAFHWESALLQIIYQTGELQADFYDLSHLSQTEQAKTVNRIEKNDREAPFHLNQPQLLRLSLLKHNDHHYTLIQTAHHSILDGWSWPILLDTIHTIYTDLKQSIPVQITEELTYLKAQEYYIENQKIVQDYWKKKIQSLEGVNDITPLLDKTDHTDFSRVWSPKEVSINIEDETYEALKGLCRKQGITLNTVIQFLWHKLLQIYTQNQQTVAGTTIAGRETSYSWH